MTTKINLRPVGRMDYLSTSGSVGERFYFYNADDFVSAVMEDNYFGVPMIVNVFRDDKNKTIALDFVKDFDPSPQGFKIIEYIEGEDENDESTEPISA